MSTALLQMIASPNHVWTSKLLDQVNKRITSNCQNKSTSLLLVCQNQCKYFHIRTGELTEPEPGKHSSGVPNKVYRLTA